jgi:thiamine biosynthesis lipoprotein
VACAEARRLERLFSLYLVDSALVELNRTGILVDPAAEMVDLLAISQRYAELTGGLFDPTVQPLWNLYADHFSQHDPDPVGPAPAAIRAALARVGYSRLSVDRNRIVMPRGMAVTLNGIAQGYVTDRMVHLLRSNGITHSLVDMGETRAIGSRPDGRPWKVGVADPDIVGRTETTLAIVDRAVATSGAYGFRFDRQGRFNHLFDPRTGGCADRYLSVTTVSRNATTADALTKPFSLMPEERIRSMLPHVDIERVHLIDAAGRPFDVVA